MWEKRDENSDPQTYRSIPTSFELEIFENHVSSDDWPNLVDMISFFVISNKRMKRKSHFSFI